MSTKMAAPFSFLRHSVKLDFLKLAAHNSARSQHALSNRRPDQRVARSERNNYLTDQDVTYPSIKSKYPPGKWGEMDHKYAWLWNSAQENQMSIPSVQGRINSLVEKEISSIVIDPINEHPSTLAFRQYVTKTEMKDWEGVEHPLYNKADSFLFEQSVKDDLKKLVSEFYLFQYERHGRTESKMQPAHQCQMLIRLISNFVITRFGKQLPHLRTCQYDEDVSVSALWDRHNIDRKRRRKTSDSDVLLFDTVQDQRIVSEGTFQAMLRSHLPLRECVSREDGVSISKSPPQLKYKLSAYGHEKLQKKKVRDIIAGHKRGDPCEFGLVGFLSTCETQSIEEQMSAQAAKDCRLAMGLTLTFSWLAAQAVNQGFSHLVDLTYPLTSQTVLTDGRTFSFLAYQLNTLELWKDDVANQIVNLCWHTKEMPLYHSVEKGKVNELNEEVLQTLLQVLCLEPESRGYNMKPTIMEQTDDVSAKTDFVPKTVVVEEVVEEEQYIVS